MGDLGQPQIPRSETAAEERLDSWKEVAVYLRRSVRTVQRWEKEDGLPIYRLPHIRRGTIYAYKSELDAWWDNHHPLLQEPEHDTVSRHPLFIWLMAAAATLAVSGVVAFWYASQLGSSRDSSYVGASVNDSVIVRRV
ncbi:helix-turn-helix domain-containing protein, partial [Acidobacteria bacterium AH-259-L09]|nr:helix-turn-helix domain-containing protein [Acidobacteria bacterium AH-259-L09]